MNKNDVLKALMNLKVEAEIQRDRYTIKEDRVWVVNYLNIIQGIMLSIECVERLED